MEKMELELTMEELEPICSPAVIWADDPCV